jgi:MFS transporter, DHA1 family, tetracycline resistance protein
MALNPPNPLPNQRQAGMPFILMTVLLDMIAIGIVIPVLPKLVSGFMGSASDTALAYGAIQVAFALAQFFSAPILGALSDRYGRKPILVLGLFGMGVNFLVTAMATEFWVLLAVRFFGGICNANVAVANAYVADITSPENRAKSYGLVSAMFGIGFILGPVMGGLLGDYDHRLPFWVAGGLTMLNCLYGYFALPESLPLEKRRPFVLSSPFVSLNRLRNVQGIQPLLWVFGLSMVAQFTLHSCWILFNELKFGWSPRDNGLSLLAVGVVAVIAQGWLIRVLEKIIPVPRLAVIATVSCTLAFFGWGYAPEGWMMFAIIGGNLLGFLLSPTVWSLISNAVDPKAQGESMGSAASINSVAAILGPLMSGPLLAMVSHLPASDWRFGTPFYVCAALQGVAALIALVYFSRYGHLAAPVKAAPAK